MDTTFTTTESVILVPEELAEKVLTVGYRHQPYEGGIGYLIHTYAKYFGAFKYVTTYRILPGKLNLIGYFIRQYLTVLRTLGTDSAIQIVHLHGAAYGSFYRKFIVFLTARYLFNRRTIYHIHGSEFKVFYKKSNALGRRLVQFMINNTDTVICLSESWKQYILENFNARRIDVIGNVIDRPTRPDEVFFERKTEGPLKVLFLGLIGDRKGVFDLLDVLRNHKATFANRLELTIGGNGDTQRLIEYIAEYGLGEMVHFAGWVSGDVKEKLLTESDVYILPSYNEGLPIAILEAMSYRLPIISTPVGGTPDVVHDGINGYLVQPGDQQAICDRLLAFVEHPDQARQMGIESGQLVKRYLPDAIFPALRAVYERLLAAAQDTRIPLS